MKTASKACAKCGSPVGEGFLLDNTYGGRLVAQWVEGQPEKGMWNGIKVKDRRQLPVRADRCGSCGYLELYAVAD